jgi:hypothetical protein
MASTDMTSYDYVLKNLYNEDEVFDACVKEDPFLGMLNKGENFTGRADIYPLRYTEAGGRSKTFATAQAQKKGSKGVDIVLPRKHDYSIGSIDGETMDASASDMGAFGAAATEELNTARDRLRKQLSKDILGDGSAAVGTVLSLSTLKVTVTDFSGVSTIRVGDSVVFAANATSALRGAAATVTDLDRSALTFSVSADAGIQAGDLIFHAGDYVTASDRNAVMGLKGYFPATVGSGAFYGIPDRRVDAVGFAGHRVNGAGFTPLEGLNRLLTNVSIDSQPDAVFVSLRRHEQIRNLIGAARLNYGERPAKGYNGEDVTRIGYKGIEVAYGTGIALVFALPYLEDSLAYTLTMGDLSFESLGKAPKLLQRSGDKFLTEASSDGVEFRFGYYGNLKVRQFSKHGVVYNYGV